MKFKHICAFLTVSTATLILSGCINQTPPKLAFLGAVSSLDNTIIYEKNNTIDLDVSLQGTISEEKEALLDLLNEGTFHTASLIDKHADKSETTFSLTSKIGPLPIDLKIPFSIDHSNQNVYVGLAGITDTLKDYIPVPTSLNEKTLSIPLADDPIGTSSDDIESLISTELISFAKALPNEKFSRTERTDKEKEHKVKEKITLTLTDSDIQEFVRTVLSKSELPEDIKTTLSKKMNDLTVDTFTMTVKIGKEGVLQGESLDVRIFERAAPQPRSWFLQSDSEYSYLTEHPSENKRLNLDQVISLNDVFKMISNVQADTSTETKKQ